jgi:hypothetical protein
MGVSARNPTPRPGPYQLCTHRPRPQKLKAVAQYLPVRGVKCDLQFYSIAFPLGCLVYTFCKPATWRVEGANIEIASFPCICRLPYSGNRGEVSSHFHMLEAFGPYRRQWRRLDGSQLVRALTTRPRLCPLDG